MSHHGISTQCTDRKYLKSHSSFANSNKTIYPKQHQILIRFFPLPTLPSNYRYADSLDYWGAKNFYRIRVGGEWWRFLTPTLLHSGVLHLLGNVMLQLNEGVTYEKEWGSLVFILIYLTSTISGSSFSCLISPGKLGVGSSGALCGLLGARLSECFIKSCSKVDGKGAKSYRKQDFLAVGCCCVVLGLMSFIPLIDWGCHLGGFIGGGLLGLSLFSFDSGARWFCTMIFLPLSVFILYSGIIWMFAALYEMAVDEYEALDDVCQLMMDSLEGYECSCDMSIFSGEE